MDPVRKATRRIIITLYDDHGRDTALILDGDGDLRHAVEIPHELSRTIMRALSQAIRIEQA